MKTRALLACCALALSISGRADDLKFRAFTIAPKHWLWLQRIAQQDPGFTPKGWTERDPPFKFYGTRSARQMYEDCGIKFRPGWAVDYSAETSTMIVRATPAGFKAIELVHHTIAAWREGRFMEWHHEGIARRKTRHPEQGS